MEDNWIKTDDKMPEDGERVLLYHKEFGLMWGKKEWRQGWEPDYWETNEGDYSLSDITHWQPFLLPPAVYR